MIADSSSKVNCTGGSSLATALRDHGPCLIPVQPNRSLPIRPAPLVPTRLFRKDYSSLMVPSNSTNLDVVEVEPAKPIGVLSEVIQKEKDAIADGQACSKGPAYSTSSLHYVIPRISGVGSPSRMKKKLKDDAEPEKSNAKEAKKKRRSQEADSSQAMEECVESSIKEFLKNFCGSNETGGARDSCTDKCARVVSTTNEETGGKVVPPLRLKKVVRPGNRGNDKWYNNFWYFVCNNFGRFLQAFFFAAQPSSPCSKAPAHFPPFHVSARSLTLS